MNFIEVCLEILVGYMKVVLVQKDNYYEINVFLIDRKILVDTRINRIPNIVKVIHV